MRVSRPASLFVWILLLAPSLAAQQAPRDPQAVVILQQALAAMGGTVPPDSVATGTVVVVAGSKTDNGTIRILTRGLDQSAEEIQTSAGIRAVVYSRGVASEKLRSLCSTAPTRTCRNQSMRRLPIPFSGRRAE